jgi:hypothetical protein
MTERGEAKRDGAKQQKNSGRGDYSKGDAQWKSFVVDYKEYSSSISISEKMWAKICTDTYKTRLAVIEWALLEELMDAWENREI